MIINHNMGAMNANRNMGINAGAANKSMEKLSSGLRINSAADDAAGLAISEKMRGQIRGLDQASSNAQDGISMIQTAEGGLSETHSILQRMRELANQSANGTNTEGDRASIQDEMNQLTSEVNRIGNTTEFNTQKVLNGGIDSNSGQKITQATSASFTAKVVTVTTSAADLTVTVDGKTFNIGGVKPSATTATAAKEAAIELGEKTSGGVKLSELIDITSDSTGKLTFTAKSAGANSEIKFSKADGGLGIPATTLVATGNPSTVESVGIDASVALGNTTDTTIAAGATLSVTVGSESAVTIKLNEGTAAKVYQTKTGVDANAQKAAMNDVIKDINAALQKSGLSDKVEASLSKDNKVQLISKTGIDIKLAEGAGTPASALGITVASDKVKNVDRVIGAGTQGTGFNTTFQIGANKGQSMSLNISDMRSAALGITGNAGQAGFTKTDGVTDGTTDVNKEAALNLLSKEDATKSIEILDKAISSVSTERGKLGAMQNRLEHTIANLGTSSENLTSAESRIRDVNMAEEMSTFSKNNILNQAAQAMLSQANQQPQQVLQLLR